MKNIGSQSGGWPSICNVTLNEARPSNEAKRMFSVKDQAAKDLIRNSPNAHLVHANLVFKVPYTSSSWRAISERHLLTKAIISTTKDQVKPVAYLIDIVDDNSMHGTSTWWISNSNLDLCQVPTLEAARRSSMQRTKTAQRTLTASRTSPQIPVGPQIDSSNWSSENQKENKSTYSPLTKNQKDTYLLYQCLPSADLKSSTPAENNSTSRRYYWRIISAISNAISSASPAPSQVSSPWIEISRTLQTRMSIPILVFYSPALLSKKVIHNRTEESKKVTY